MSSLSRLVGVAAAVLVAAAPVATAVAKPKPKSSPKCAAKAKGKAKAKGCKAPAIAATKVTVGLLDGSLATVDIPAVPLPGGYVLPGVPATKDVPISGTLTGSMPGYKLNQDNDLSITGAAIALAPVDLLADSACGGASALKLDPASNVVLDTAAPSPAKIFASGKVSASVHVLLKLAFDSRTGMACDSPLVPMGTSQTPLAVNVEGTIDKATGLNRIKLDGPPVQTSVFVCLTPGTPGTACATPPVAYPVGIAVHALVKVAFG